MDAVVTRGLSKTFGAHTAVNNLNLTIPQGSVFGLIGANGAGKTTTMRMLVDLIRPTSGRIEVLGVDPRAGGAALRQRIGYVPGELHLPRHGSGARVIDYLDQLTGGGHTHRIHELAEILEVDLQRPVKKLSKGNKQKIGLIQAFAHQPELLMLDEPTSGLDPLMQRRCMELFRDAAHRGATVVLSSHVLPEIEHLADEIAVLNKGELIATGPVHSLHVAHLRLVTARISGIEHTRLNKQLADLPGVKDVVIRPVENAPESLHLECTVTDDIDAVMRILVTGRLEQLRVHAPDLESSVLALYE